MKDLMSMVRQLRFSAFLLLILAGISFAATERDSTNTERTDVQEQAIPKTAAAPIFTSQPTAKRPQAVSIELNEPVVDGEPEFQGNTMAPVVEAMPEGVSAGESAGESTNESINKSANESVNESADDSTDQSPAVEGEQSIPEISPLVILDTEVLPSTTTRLSWSPSQTMEGIATPTPVLIVNGAQQGPVLCLTAAIHGDELNGIEVVRRTLYNLNPTVLSGTVIGVPIVNLQGFHRSSRYLTDRRDLNRFFPGNPQGSSASRIAYSFFQEVISHCDALVDLHTGSFHRTNMPQLRADLSNPKIVELTQGFGATVVLHSTGAMGTLRRAAADAGIPTVTLEAGESMRLQEASVKHGVNGINTLMNHMGMLDKFSLWGDPEPIYYKSTWVRSERGGILFSNVKLAARVDQGDLLGVVTDPITNIKSEIRSPYDGRVIGMALNQVVLPGFAAFHIGIRAPEALIPEPEKIISPPEAEDDLASAEANTESEPGRSTPQVATAVLASPVASEADVAQAEVRPAAKNPQSAQIVPAVVAKPPEATSAELSIVNLDRDIDDEDVDGETIYTDDFD